MCVDALLGDGDEGLSYYAVAVARRNNPSVNFKTLKDKVACFPGQFINLFVISVHFCGEHDAQYCVRLQYYGEEHSEIVAKITSKRIENNFCSCRQQWHSNRVFRRFNEPGPPSSWGPRVVGPQKNFRQDS